MKLKKIASLALAGIMAVSMLAGCGEAASSSEPTTPRRLLPAQLPLSMQSWTIIKTKSVSIMILFCRIC